MKLYEAIFVYDDGLDGLGLVKVGDKFVIWKGHLVPHNSKNGLGLSMRFLGLNNKKKFDKHFKECGESRGTFQRNLTKDLKQKIKNLQKEIDWCQKDLDLLELA
jgi:hypothetical protein